MKKVEPRNLKKGDFVCTNDGVFEVVEIDKDELHLELAKVRFVDDESDEYKLLDHFKWTFSEFRRTDFRKC